jgi:hypothetical protein
VRQACSDVDLLRDPAQLAAAYRSSRSIAELAVQVGVSNSTVRRALVRHGIARLPRNRNRRPPSARMLDNPTWLRERYRTATGVEIAKELGVAARTVYSAMERHGIERRAEPGALKLRRPQLAEEVWLKGAVESASSRRVAVELAVSAGTVTAAYERAGIDPPSTTHLYERGRSRQRPKADELRAVWDIEGSFRGVGRRLGIAHTTAAAWLAEIGVFAEITPELSRSVLLDAIERQWPIARIATEHEVSAVTVRVELHRHGLFAMHRNRHRAIGDVNAGRVDLSKVEVAR